MSNLKICCCAPLGALGVHHTACRRVKQAVAREKQCQAVSTHPALSCQLFTQQRMPETDHQEQPNNNDQMESLRRDW